MKTRVFLAVLGSLAFAACSGEEGDPSPDASAAEATGAAVDVAALTQEAREITKSFGGALKGELQASMMADGPVAAIEVCNVRAPEIAAAKAEASGWHVARTSHRVRNAGNAPDAWESEQLALFAKLAESGDPMDAMEVSQVIESPDGAIFRYMKAIPTGEVCVVCHGSDLAPEISERLDVLYPDDAARGFEVGALRGAFTIQKRLK